MLQPKRQKIVNWFAIDYTRVYRFPVVLSPVSAPEGGAEFHPLIALTVISQPGRARGQTYYPLISFQISKPIQVPSAQASLQSPIWGGTICRVML